MFAAGKIAVHPLNGRRLPASASPSALNTTRLFRRLGLQPPAHPSSALRAKFIPCAFNGCGLFARSFAGVQMLTCVFSGPRRSFVKVYGVGQEIGLNLY